MAIIFLIINVNFYIDELNGFLAAYEAFFDFLLSLATVLMVIATAWVAFENKKLREHQLEPIVFIDAQQRKGFHEIIYLIIRNIGLGPAYDVKFDVNNSDLKVNSDKYISEIGILKDGLSYIPPYHEWRL